MRAFVILLGLVLGWGAASGEDKGIRAEAQGLLALAELEGAVVEATVIMHRVVQRDGREFAAKFQSDVKLIIGPDDQLKGTIISTASSPRGVRKGKPQTFSSKVERPKEIKLSGGGHSVWIFDQGTLTHLRTFKGGAYKRDIAFARTSDGVTCTVQETFAQEEGVGHLLMNSPIDNAPMRVVSSKQLTSNCKVTQGKR